MNKRRAGILYLRINGELQEAKGDFSYNLGHPKREALVGTHSVHGFKETVQVPFIEGAITDARTLDLKNLVNLEDVLAMLELANGKTIVGNQMWYAGEGTVTTGEAEIAVRFESEQPLEEI